MKDIIPFCPICKSEHIHFYTNSYDKHYGWFDKTYQVYTCDDCGLLFLNPMITDAELFQMYPEDYYSTKDIDTMVNHISTKRFLDIIRNWLFNTEAKDLKRNFAGENVLDLGVGNCSQLYSFKQRGCLAYGTEIRESACEIGKRLGLNITNGTLLEAHYPNEFFQYVRSNHSFEHLTNPHETLDEIYRILKPSGELFIGVPNTESYTFRKFRENWYYLGVPFHPFSYSKSNLIKIVEQHGFKANKIEYNGSWVGLLGGIQIRLHLNNKKKSNEGILWNPLSKICLQPIAFILNKKQMGDCIEITFKKI